MSGMTRTGYFPKLVVEEVQIVYPELPKKAQSIRTSGIITQYRGGSTFIDETKLYGEPPVRSAKAITLNFS
jgi:hypothetical protein